MAESDIEIKSAEPTAPTEPDLGGIAGFANALKGSVVVGDTTVSALPPWKRDVGLVFQSYALWPHKTVGSNVAFGLEERRIPRAEITRRVNAAL